MNDVLITASSILTDYILVIALLIAAVWFTFATRGVQFRMFGEMCRLLLKSDNDPKAPATHHRHVSSFQAFTVSIASRVGVGNLAGVATAITLGGPGAIFWMWAIALLGAASAFIESTLAQLFKVQGKDSYRGGPAYYILKGTGKRWWAVTFAVLIAVTFGLAFNSVQSNTVAMSLSSSFGVPVMVTAVILTALSVAIICGGITGIARFSQLVVPVMAVLYIVVALFVMVINLDKLPQIFGLIFGEAFGISQVAGGSIGGAMAIGIRRGLFSNEAGEGSAPNAAATATVSHPVKQGLIQTLGVFTDTLLICSATAFIILCSGHWTGSQQGIVLTQQALDTTIGLAGFGSSFVAIAIFFFAFTSIVANYYYGETNLLFIRQSKWLIYCYRALVGALVFIGAIQPLGFVWQFADVTMTLMTLCNLAALSVLGKYALRCLHDYESQRLRGYDPVYHRRTIPSIASHTECWPE
ncbi:MAG: alanine:cation symporter family protein [Candidatus Amulumruptor caecigallinarius]|nr:alanine:cation symporter family protein [Candidatus Amulumruptor caecigallinarius]MCM1397287.1 alanine:cation symporter family protein [Candidatus Amulumruptor caecigallinarius]MCM1453648.1 alanine:cation symporter family protein [bacterium]